MLHLAGDKIRGLIEGKRAAKRKREIEAEFPDFLRFMASCLRAGLSLTQTLIEASDRIKGPVGEELATAAGETRAGVPVGDVLAGLAHRTGSADAAAASVILRASIKYGGDTAEALDRLGAVAGRRDMMRREINALTAQARLSAMILSFLPAGFFLIFPAPADIFMSGRGLAVVSVGITLNISGYLAMRFISDPERLS